MESAIVRNEPLRVGEAIIIGEDDVLALRLAKRSITSMGGPPPRFSEMPQGQKRRVALDHFVNRGIAAIVYDEHFEACLTIVECVDRFQAAVERHGTVASGNNNRKTHRL